MKLVIRRTYKVIRTIVAGAFACLALAGAGYTLRTAMAADAAKPLDYANMKPPDIVAQVPKGELKNPYKETQADVVAQGEHLFLSYGCNGCHGGGGGGGMCPPLTNDTWVYEGDDDTLFRLITLGSVELQAKGYARKGRENVVGPMPPFGALIKSGDDIWKILAFVRTRYSSNADQAYKYGTPPELR
jgi:mono/diheme cytochrome c family protein